MAVSAPMFDYDEDGDGPSSDPRSARAVPLSSVTPVPDEAGGTSHPADVGQVAGGAHYDPDGESGGAGSDEWAALFDAAAHQWQREVHRVLAARRDLDVSRCEQFILSRRTAVCPDTAPLPGTAEHTEYQRLRSLLRAGCLFPTPLPASGRRTVRYLVAVKDDDLCRLAVQRALLLAQPGDEIFLLSLFHGPRDRAPSVKAVDDAARTIAAKSPALAATVYAFVQRAKHVGPAICDFVRPRGIDSVIIGCRREATRERWMPRGCVSNYVAHHCPTACVIAVRHVQARRPPPA
eukprot:TRINITY_DN50730_c0_g1_i1.p1 TRINITY_DN50730_c0_g1~~TRINITY_DN50730_c0_g1_i1.p1  ORF type:complete len:292 (+),score=40.62 TRINITY_DN50730_c0_g1_i1:188-1063(+)